MFGFSGERLLVLLVILLIFGPKRLPDLGHSLGRTLKNFKDAMAGNSQESAQPIPPASQIQAEQKPAPQAAAQEHEKQAAEKV